MAKKTKSKDEQIEEARILDRGTQSFINLQDIQIRRILYGLKEQLEEEFEHDGLKFFSDFMVQQYCNVFADTRKYYENHDGAYMGTVKGLPFANLPIPEPEE